MSDQSAGSIAVIVLGQRNTNPAAMIERITGVAVCGCRLALAERAVAVDLRARRSLTRWHERR
ncbi:hypothetical protein [Salinisphaera sp.]|uniref:hypothetical protein n=1 Tax=Salinisphaera sp. TaxID=1914330 RepID=UPI0025E730E0|nr:hypothetical protein [Salinisphaera sp.]|tara:strand:- start:6585 stop:6773 length:189 start_codon:yes stop_codon:yes gene_type:complete